MYSRIEPSGCCVRHGMVQVRIAMYLEPGDYGYDQHYIEVPDVPPGESPPEFEGETQVEYEKKVEQWVAQWPKIWQLNPFHNHLLRLEPTTTVQEVSDLAQIYLSESYTKWAAGFNLGQSTDSPKNYGKKREWSDRYLAAKWSSLKPDEQQAVQDRIDACTARVNEIKLWNIQLHGGLIDIGHGAVNEISNLGSVWTRLDKTNPANDTGIIDTFECWFDGAAGNPANVQMGTFSGSGTTWENRDGETLGSVTKGSKQTFSGLDCDVAINDVIGTYYTAGNIECNFSGGGGVCSKSGDQFGTGSQSGYSCDSISSLSLYGTGETTGGSPSTSMGSKLLAARVI